MKFCTCGRIIKLSKREGNRNECRACRMRKWRSEHVVRATYCNWRTNTAERGIPNDVTLMQFARFCVETGYIYLRSIGQDMTIDRKDSTKHYTIDNIQMLPRAENSRKQRREISYLLAQRGAKQPGDVF